MLHILVISLSSRARLVDEQAATACLYVFAKTRTIHHAIYAVEKFLKPLLVFCFDLFPILFLSIHLDGMFAHTSYGRIAAWSSASQTWTYNSVTTLLTTCVWSRAYHFRYWWIQTSGDTTLIQRCKILSVERSWTHFAEIGFPRPWFEHYYLRHELYINTSNFSKQLYLFFLFYSRVVSPNRKKQTPWNSNKLRKKTPLSTMFDISIHSSCQISDKNW